MGIPMGLNMGLGPGSTSLCKRKFRWLFYITNLSATGIRALPPLRSSRPKVDLQEMQARHLNEDVFYPAKPQWQPITLTLFDLKRSVHPVFDWLKNTYDPETGDWNPPLKQQAAAGGRTTPLIQSFATLDLYDGCGNCVEKWVYEDVWPSGIDFGQLDMSTSDFVTVDITLRYARAYLQNC